MKTLLLALALAAPLFAQQPPPQPSPLDPTRNLPAPPATASMPLPEEYIWTAGDLTQRRPDRSKFSWARTDLRIDPHFFRAHFSVAQLPPAATVYIAGPRQAHIFLNGHLLGDFSTSTDQPINFRVFHVDASRLLKKGDNVLAVQAIRGRGVVSGAGPLATQELAYGEVLAAKVIPAAFGVVAPALLVSNLNWRSSTTFAPDWTEPSFNDAAWPRVDSLGAIESDPDFFQWSADAGMYGWPGYRGMSPSLRTLSLPPVATTHTYAGSAVLTTSPLSLSHFIPGPDSDSPAILLDFGREIAGRLVLASTSACDATVSVAYGESELEALATGLTPENRGGNYLGTNLLDVPAHGEARGPKSGFRYARVRFLRGCPSLAFNVHAEAIFYPVTYSGSFESSDPLLNRIWETGAYTVHLCMQDGIWDAPKRDRGRWVGDLDVEGRTILTAFGDSFLIEDTLRRLAAATPPTQHVNGIASYTALWITSLETLFQHTDDRAYLGSQHAALLQFVARMDQDLGPDSLVAASSKGWGFVDWAPGFYGQTEDTRIGTTMQFLRGYEAASILLNALGDTAHATSATQRARAIERALIAFSTGSAKRNLGASWQLNSLAAITQFDPRLDPALWADSLAHVKQDAPSDPIISPYFGAYLLDAMSTLHHPEAALAWIRTYWGGMLAEGATSFWESYDLRWQKNDFHLGLQADGTSGFFVSLAHGWSSGPTAWLSENVLGITPVTPGYDIVRVAPQLLGLTFARGSVPTPHGRIAISADANRITLDLPTGITQAIVVPPGSTETQSIDTPGHHVIEYH